MKSYQVMCVEAQHTRERQALEYLQAALMADRLSPFPTRALSREVINEAFRMADLEPVEDREVDIIGLRR